MTRRGTKRSASKSSAPNGSLRSRSRSQNACAASGSKEVGKVSGVDGRGSSARKRKHSRPPLPSRINCYEVIKNIVGKSLRLRLLPNEASNSKRARMGQLKTKNIDPFKVEIPAVLTDGKYEWSLEDERSALRHKLWLQRKRFVESQRIQARSRMERKAFHSSKVYFDISDLIKKKDNKSVRGNFRKLKKKGRRPTDKRVDELGMDYAFLCGTVIRICIDRHEDWRRAVITKFNPKDGKHYVEIEEAGAEDKLKEKWAEERRQATGTETKTTEGDVEKEEDSEQTESDGEANKNDQISRTEIEDEVRLMGELGSLKGQWMRLSEYRIQEYVGMCWAKVRGQTDWPSQIAREHYANTEGKDNNKFLVLFCGLHTHAFLPRDKLIRWDVLYNKRAQRRNVRAEWGAGVEMGASFHKLHRKLREQYRKQAEEQIELMRTANAPPEDWVGKRISIFFSGDGKWFEATVLRLNRHTGKHFVFYDDGENEWTNLTAVKRDEIRILSQGGEENRRRELKLEAEEAEATREVCWFCEAPVVRESPSLGNGDEAKSEDLRCSSCSRACHKHCFNEFKKSVEEKYSRDRLNPALSSTAVKLGSGAFGDPRQPWCDNCARKCEHCKTKKKQKMHTLLACEICQRRFHAECLDPKLDPIPQESWVCRDCMRCQCCFTTRASEESRYLELVMKYGIRKKTTPTKSLILKITPSSHKNGAIKSKSSRKAVKSGSKSKRLQAQHSMLLNNDEENSGDEEQENIKALEWMHHSVCPRCTDKFEVRRYCPGCILPLRDDLKMEDTVKCDTCSRYVHRECSGLHQKAYDLLMRNREERAKVAKKLPKKKEIQEVFKPGSRLVIASPEEEKTLPSIRYECSECINRRGSNCMARVIERLTREDQYSVFLYPVSDEHAPNYSRIIKTPMDFSTISRRLKALEYDEEQLRQHVNLVWRNALDYNPQDNMIARLALRLQRLSIGLFARLHRRLKALENEQKWKDTGEILKLTAGDESPEGIHKADSDDSADESDDASMENDPRLRKPSHPLTVFGMRIRASLGPEMLRIISQLVRATDLCLVCGSMGDQDKMVFCLDCGEAFHLYCLSGPARQRWERAGVETPSRTDEKVATAPEKPLPGRDQESAAENSSHTTKGNEKFVSSKSPNLKLRLDWQCEHCVTCHRCGGDGNQNQMLICVDCGSVCHLLCANPPLSKHMVPFRCAKCVSCRHCGATDAAGLEGVMSYGDVKPHWMYDFTMCYPCGTLYKQKKYCPVCQCLWELPKGHTGAKKDDAGGFVQCDRCRLWVHTRCDDIINDDNLNLLDEEVNYFCPDCRSSSMDDSVPSSERESDALRLKQKKGQFGNIAPTLMKNYLYYRQRLLQIMRMRAKNTKKANMTPNQRFFWRMRQEVHQIQCARKRRRRNILLQTTRKKALIEAGLFKQELVNPDVRQRVNFKNERKKNKAKITNQKEVSRIVGNEARDIKIPFIPEPVFEPSAQTREYDKALKMHDDTLKINIDQMKRSMVRKFQQGGYDKMILVQETRMQIEETKVRHAKIRQVLLSQRAQQLDLDKRRHEMKVIAVKELRKQYLEKAAREAAERSKTEAIARAKREMETSIREKENKELIKIEDSMTGSEKRIARKDGTKVTEEHTKPVEKAVNHGEQLGAFPKKDATTESKTYTTNPLTSLEAATAAKTRCNGITNAGATTSNGNKLNEETKTRKFLEQESGEQKHHSGKALAEHKASVINPALASRIEIDKTGKIPVRQLIQCMICGKRERDISSNKSQDTYGGRLLPLISTHKILLGHVHMNCALWSPEVSKKGCTLSSVDTAIRRASLARCSKCFSMGANIRCAATGCTNRYHFICFVRYFEEERKNNQRPVFQKDGKIFCASHFNKSSSRLQLADAPSSSATDSLFLQPVKLRSVSPHSNPFFHLTFQRKNHQKSGIARATSETTQNTRTSQWSHPMNDLHLAGVADYEKDVEDRNKVLTKRADLGRSFATPGEWTRIGSLCVWNLGSIEQTSSNHFHTQNSIFPLGYRSTRIWWDCMHPSRRTVYTCEVIAAPSPRNGDLYPRFRITGPNVKKYMAHGPSEKARLVIEAPTAAAAWKMLAERLPGFNCRNGKRRREFGHEQAPFGLSGSHFFGFGHLEVLRKIEYLPGAHRCQHYKFLFRTEDAIAALRAQEHQVFDPCWIIDRTNPYGISPPSESQKDPRSNSRFKSKKGCVRAHPYTTEIFSTKCTSLFAKDFGRRAKVFSEAPPFELRYQENLRMPMSLRYHRLKKRRHKCVVMPSQIHAWGLFATEHIGRDEMVIEYLGELIRQSVADLREKRYEADGIGSCYMFRLDENYIVDSTTRGNVSRFINHSCDPNCYTQVVQYKKANKIVVLAKRDILKGEEITYDYKFQSESGEGIPCSCGAPNCAGRLN